MKGIVSLCALLSVVLVGTPAWALELLAPYDDFNANRIDPDKWDGGRLDSARILELSMGIQSGRSAINPPRRPEQAGPREGRLQMVNRAYGNTDSNSGNLRNVLRLQFVNPVTVTAIEATVQVNEFEVTACVGNPTASRTGARLLGDFFNTGGFDPVTGDPTPIANNATNDVFASIRIRRRSDSLDLPDVLQVAAGVFLCADRRCRQGANLAFEILGLVDKGEQVMVRIQHDPDNDQFIFQLDNEAEVFLMYAVSDALPPGRPTQGLSIHNFVANCTTEPRPVAFMEVLYDDVSVNESAAP